MLGSLLVCLSFLAGDPAAPPPPPPPAVAHDEAPPCCNGQCCPRPTGQTGQTGPTCPTASHSTERCVEREGCGHERERCRARHVFRGRRCR